MRLQELLNREFNRRARRKFKNKSELDGKSKKFYTTKQTHRRKNGKKARKSSIIKR